MLQFFKMTQQDNREQIPKNASATAIMMADSTILKVGNQKNRWQEICI